MSAGGERRRELRLELLRLQLVLAVARLAHLARQPGRIPCRSRPPMSRRAGSSGRGPLVREATDLRPGSPTSARRWAAIRPAVDVVDRRGLRDRQARRRLERGVRAPKAASASASRRVAALTSGCSFVKRACRSRSSAWAAWTSAWARVRAATSAGPRSCRPRRPVARRRRRARLRSGPPAPRAPRSTRRSPRPGRDPGRPRGSRRPSSRRRRSPRRARGAWSGTTRARPPSP